MKYVATWIEQAVKFQKHTSALNSYLVTIHHLSENKTKQTEQFSKGCIPPFSLISFYVFVKKGSVLVLRRSV